MQIGELFILRINIHLNGSVLDTPELFWVEPHLEPVYQAVRSYLEMDQRVGLLTERLDVIADLLAVLKGELSHGHGEMLEWIGKSRYPAVPSGRLLVSILISSQLLSSSLPRFWWPRSTLWSICMLAWTRSRRRLRGVSFCITCFPLTCPPAVVADLSHFPHPPIPYNIIIGRVYKVPVVRSTAGQAGNHHVHRTAWR